MVRTGGREILAVDRRKTKKQEAPNLVGYSLPPR
jgi:hypothetical protein